MACVYRRSKQFWISYYIDGRQVKKSLGTTNERVARSKLKQIEYELALGDLHLASKLELAPVLEKFCQHLAAARTHKSYKNDFSRLRIFFGPVCESLKPGTPGVKRGQKATKVPGDKYAGKHVVAEVLEDISPQTINRFLASRVERDGWSAKTANLMRQTLHKLFAYAIKHHGFRSRDRRYPNPAIGVDRRREPTPQIRFLSLGQIQQQLQALRNCLVIHAMVATYVYAGLRREEAIWLTHDDIDVRRRLIRVQAKTIDGESWQPKTKRNRVVPISDALFEILAAYRPNCDCVWLFPSPTGKRWDPDNFSHDLRSLNKANGLAWGCLDFRHTFGSQLAQKGESLYKISTLMGNSPEICRRHYAALIPEEMTKVVEFGAPHSAPVAEDKTEKMLQQILEKLGDNRRPDPELSQLRLVRPSESA